MEISLIIRKKEDREILTKKLESLGHEVRLAKASLTSPIVIISSSELKRKTFRKPDRSSFYSNVLILMDQDQDTETLYKAIRNGFNDVIHYPLLPNELEICLKRSAVLLKAKSEWQGIREMTRSNFIRKDIAKLSVTPMSEPELNLKYGLTLRKGHYRGILLKYDKKEDVMSVFEDKQLRKILAEVIHNALSDKCYDIIYDMMGDGVLAIMNYDSDYSALIESRTRSILHYANIALSERKDITITLCISKEFSSTVNLPEIKFEAIDAKWSRMKPKSGRIIKAENKETEDSKIKSYAEWISNNIILAFESLNKERCMKFFSDFFTKYNDILDTRMVRIFLKTTTYKIIETFTAMASDSIDIETEHHELMFKMNMAGSFSGVLVVLEEEIGKLITIIKDKYSPACSSPVDKALKIMKREGLDISLKDMADRVSLSPSYFSTLFHNETGIKYKEYIIQGKVDLAKKLIKTRPDLSIGGISEACGFRTIQAFSRFFKTYVKTSPTAFRETLATDHEN